MSRHYTHIATQTRGPFEVIVDRTWEDVDPWDQLSECFDDKDRLYRDIDSGKYEWFMLRVRVMFKGIDLATEYLGGCLYEDAEDVMTDGNAENIIGEALESARERALELKAELVEACLEELDIETV